MSLLPVARRFRAKAKGHRELNLDREMIAKALFVEHL